MLVHYVCTYIYHKFKHIIVVLLYLFNLQNFLITSYEIDNNKTVALNMALHHA